MKYQAKIVISKLKKYLDLPLIIFTTFIIITIISIFGTKYIRSAINDDILSSQISQNCEKTGVNSAYPLKDATTKEFQMAKDLGMKYYLGNIYSDSDLSITSKKINEANTYGITIIVRICDIVNPCGFIPPNEERYSKGAWRVSGQRYGQFLKAVSERVDTYFYAIGGHNEPNGDYLNQITGGATEGEGIDKIAPNLEKAFIDGLLETDVSNDPNIRLLSPQLDLHNSNYPYKTYVIDMGGKEIFNSFDGIAVATYGTVPGPEPEGSPPERVEDAYQFFNKQIFVTETGMMDRELDELIDNFKKMRDSDHTGGVLLFNGFYQNRDKAFNYHEVFENNPKLIQKVIGECGEYGVTAEKSIVNECAFEESPVIPCEEDGNLSLETNLTLYLNEESKTWQSEWYATAKIDKLPSFKYFHSTDYTGTSDTNTGGSPEIENERLSTQQIWDPVSKQQIFFDVTKSIDGYGYILLGGTQANINYKHGSGVLRSSMGIPIDYTQSGTIPRQFIEEEKESTIHDTDIKTDHAGDLWNDFKSLIGLNKYCKKAQFPIDDLYSKDVTSGYESEFDHGEYSFTLQDIIHKSDLAETYGGQCETTGGSCQILSRLSSCNSCNDVREDIPEDDPAYDPDNPYKYVRTCPNIEHGTGVIINEEALTDCIGNRVRIMHKTESSGTFKLGGAAHILESYWKQVQLQSPKRICHNKNIGIKAELESKLYETDPTCKASGYGCGEGNVCLNPGFEYLARAVHKDNWFLSSGWYPWWNPDGTKQYETEAEYQPEYGVFFDPNRNNDTAVQKVFVTGATLDAGFFYPVQLDKPLQNNTITVSFRFQPFVGSIGLTYGEHNDELRVSAGLMQGNANDVISSDDFRVNPPNSGITWSDHEVKFAEPGDGETPPGWGNFEYTFNSSSISNSQAFTLFLRGISPNPHMNNNFFADDVCIYLDGDYTNTLAIDTTPHPSSFWQVGEYNEQIGGGYCEADPKFIMPNCTSTRDTSSYKAYFPYFGTLINYSTEFLNKVQTADDKIVEDIDDCIGDKNETICYCRENEIDPLGLYLYKIGMLENDSEIALSGFNKNELDDALEGNMPEDDEDTEDRPSRYSPTISEELMELLGNVSNQIKESTGQCIPKEMIAAIMSIETGTNYSVDDIYKELRSSNSNWCDRINKSCAGGNTTPRFGSDDYINEVMQQIRRDYEDCTRSRGQIYNQECFDARTLGGTQDMAHRCCDVRGIMQFEISTWIGYSQNVKSISPEILELYEYNIDKQNYTAKRARVIDSIVASGLKLRSDCDGWINNEEYTVKYEAGCYVGGCNINSNYAKEAWDIYIDFKRQFSN